MARFAVTSENYEVVVDVVKRRFGKKRWIRQSLHKKLMQLKAADKKNIREMVEEVKRILRHLEKYE